jgi:hypothetical protein
MKEIERRCDEEGRKAAGIDRRLEEEAISVSIQGVVFDVRAAAGSRLFWWSSLLFRYCHYRHLITDVLCLLMVFEAIGENV